jgi:carbon storage regulator CsrA
MLVLSRKRNESVVLTLEDGRIITFTIVDQGPARTRLGIEAPPTVQVDRSEVYERKRSEAA